MKYLYAILAIIILVACNLSSPVPTSLPTLDAPIPVDVNTSLELSPIIHSTDDGRAVLEAQTRVTVSWNGLPEGSVPIFILSNFLADGGVSEIGQGTSVSFVVPDRIDGEISASVALANGGILNAGSIRIVTPNMISDNCQYLPPALGPGVNLYSEPDLNSNTLGSVIFDAEYEVLAVADGVDDKGGARSFYQIEQVGTDTRGWVPSNVGENLAGDCAAFQ